MQQKKYPQFLPASIKDVSGKQGIVTGYLASFGNLDADGDIIMQGAFTKTLNEKGPASAKPRIKYLLDHSQEKALGVFNTLKENAKGLYYEAQVGTHNLGQDFIKMVSSGLITEHSIGFQIVKKTIMNPEADWQNQQRQLNEINLWEGSALQCWGANCDTPMMGMKSHKYAADRIGKLIEALKNGTFTDSTFELLEKELIFLQAIFKSTGGTTEPDHPMDPMMEPMMDTTQPNEDDLSNMIAMANASMRCLLT